MLWFLFVGVIAGWLAGHITHGSGFGLIGDLVVGIVGALVGGFIFKIFSIDTYGTLGDIVMATVGAVVMLVLLRMI